MSQSIMLFAMFGLGPTEMIIVGAVAVLLFGSRLPSVARSMGKSLTEFKKGMSDVENDFHDAVYSEPTGRVDYDHHNDHEEPAAPRFEPPTTPPQAESDESKSDDAQAAAPQTAT